MRRSPLVTLLLLVGFAVISVTVWNLSGCSKGGKGDKSDTGPQGITLELAASSSQAQVFRNIELTATLKNAYNMPIADESVVFQLVSKTKSKGMATPLHSGRPSDIFLPRGTSIAADQQRALTNQRGQSGVRRPASKDPASAALDGRADFGRRSAAEDLRNEPLACPRSFAPKVVPLAQTAVALDKFDVNAIFADVVTDSMGIAGVVVTSETLMNYAIIARHGTGTQSNQLFLRFVANPSYRCSLRLTADKTVAYTGSDNP